MMITMERDVFKYPIMCTLIIYPNFLRQDVPMCMFTAYTGHGLLRADKHYKLQDPKKKNMAARRAGEVTT